MAKTSTNNTPTKYCLRCQKVLPAAMFFPNKDWTQQMRRDAWCKDCAIVFCKTKENVKRYCRENNRVFKESGWIQAINRAQLSLSKDPEYIAPDATSAKRAKMEETSAARGYLMLMNQAAFYEFADTSGMADPEEPEEKPKQQQPDLTYDKKWRGYFTPEQIELLEDIYAQYEEDFVLDNVSMRDYARKVAKASLNADIAEDRMRRGEISASEYKEAQKIFDDLSKSSNFAACRRKPGETAGLGSLGEIIMRLEIAGELKENGFTFPPDDVDKIILDFRHTLAAVGIDPKI